MAAWAGISDLCQAAHRAGGTCSGRAHTTARTFACHISRPREIRGSNKWIGRHCCRHPRCPQWKRLVAHVECPISQSVHHVRAIFFFIHGLSTLLTSAGSPLRRRQPRRSPQLLLGGSGCSSRWRAARRRRRRCRPVECRRPFLRPLRGRLHAPRKAYGRVGRHRRLGGLFRLGDGWRRYRPRVPRAALWRGHGAGHGLQ